MNRGVKSNIDKGRICIIVMLFLIVVWPLMVNVLSIRWMELPRLITSLLFIEATWHSISTSVVATLVAISLAGILVYIIGYTEIKFKLIFKMIFLVPMLIPSISHGMGLINLFGERGMLTSLLGIKIELYGFNGIVMGAVLYSFPVAFLMLLDVSKYMNQGILDNAKILGVPKWRVFLDIVIPILRGPIMVIAFAVFTMVFTDYGVPLAVGGTYQTLPVYLYREVVGLLNFSRGGIIAVVLLMPALMQVIIEQKVVSKIEKDINQKGITIKKSNMRDYIALIVAIGVAIIVFAPILSYAVVAFTVAYPQDASLSFEHLEMVREMELGKYVFNSIVIALSTAFVGTTLAYLTAYKVERGDKNRLSQVLHGMAIASLAVPGIVLGLGYIQVFVGSFLYGTSILLILANVVHFFASPYIMAKNAIGEQSIKIEEMADVLGISRYRMIWDVLIPATRYTIIEMFAYFFVNAMITISAVAFLVNTRNMPVSLMINQLEAQMMFEGAAIVSLIILGINIIFKLVIYLIKKYLL